MRIANSFFSFFMAVGNVLVYAAGSYTHLYKMFPFTKTKACDVYYTNLKSCFFLSIFLLLILTILALIIMCKMVVVPSQAESPENGGHVVGKKGKIPVLGELFGALKGLPKPVRILLLVTCLDWIAWFPFLLFDIDWMGKEVYGGKVGEGKLYDHGVRAGALGLMLSAVVLGCTSLAMEFLARGLGGVKWLWGIANFLLAVCLAMTVGITKLASLLDVTPPILMMVSHQSLVSRSVLWPSSLFLEFLKRLVLNTQNSQQQSQQSRGSQNQNLHYNS